MRDSKAEFEFVDFTRRNRPPAPAKTHLRAVPSKRYASPDTKGEILATAVIAALLLCLAKFFGAP